MGSNKTFLISEITKYSRKLDQKNFGANHDGNISAKLDDVLLATPTAVSKGNVVEDLIITLDANGNKIAGIGKPFSEIKLHLAAYRANPTIQAVVHAHPPFATARGLVNLPIKPALPEAIVSLGDLIPVVEFALPGASENDRIIADAIAQYDVFMLPGNGVFAVGNCIEQAYLRLELVEHLAKIDYYARALGTPMELNNPDVQNLLEKRAAAGLGAKAVTKAAAPNQIDLIKKMIAEEIKAAIIEKN